MDARDTAEPPGRNPGGSLTERVDTFAFDRRTVEAHFWALAVLALVADTHLTWVGLQRGVPEGNPVVALAIAAGGIWALVLGKLAVLGIAGLVRKRYPRHGPVIPLGLAIPWVAATALNAVTLA